MLNYALSIGFLLLTSVASSAEVSVGSCDDPNVRCEFLSNSQKAALNFENRVRIRFNTTLESCKRTIYISHGGESDHRDLGAGRVEYVEWWSQEGVFEDVLLANCDTGKFLRTRVREARISERAPFDVGKKAAKLIEVELAASPALFSFERLADALKGTGRDIEIAVLADEPCACAALYPELQGTKTPFEDLQ